MGINLLAFSRWRRRRGVQNASTVFLVVLAPVLVILTITALRPLDQTGRTETLRLILLADIIYVLVIAALVLSRVVSMIAARRNKSAGSRLHLRLTGVFGLLALIPTVAVAVFAVLTINIGLEGWFSERVRDVLGNSLSAAQAYEEEHRQEVARDGQAVAGYLNTERLQTFFMDPGEVRQALARVQPQIERGLTEVFVLDAFGEIWARGGELSYEFYFEKPTLEQIEQARADGLIVIEDYPNNEFRALIPLDAFNERYLYVTREVDGEILGLLDDTQETVALYEQIEDTRGRVLFEFGLIYLGFALILILASVWVGLWFAERLARPVGRLVGASQRVGAGDLNVRVREEEGEDEIAQLGRYFNQMTAQLRDQREELLDNTRQIERRRRLFDSVLSSVPSGVVGLDEDGRVTFVNRSANRLLEVDGGQHTALSAAVPEFSLLFDEITIGGKSVAQGQVNLVRGAQQESLLVRMSHRLREDGALEGYVVAFEDVTDLVSAQRMAAWGDVAQRIAHEIKNPLTPIQLSAERIKRKFSREVDVPADLEQLTNVIVRQTNDLRRIVDEFSKFARMPEPDRHIHDLTAILRAAVTLQKAGQPDVVFDVTMPDREVWANLDDTMMTQALTNLVKNAGEAIETLLGKNPEVAVIPTIKVAMTCDGDTARITVADNGIGLPEDRAKLFEPYVTTRDKGTGLGLPIVKKIIDEHGGNLSLTNAEPFDETGRFGAMAVIIIPIQAADPLIIKETA
ncbi:PAS domain-containing sensor histidine kinase [Octadecabacter sp.]|nr:PAS domain-containing sensor histidine kinase [Octadecabacter sp.]